MFERVVNGIGVNSAGVTLVAVVLIVLQSLWWWHVLRQAKTQTASVVDTTAWVLYASQSGQAEQLAAQTAEQLSRHRQTWQAISLVDWQRGYDLSTLNGQTVLFVVSTQGKGDPPDNAVVFFRKLCAWDGDLSHLTFAVLGLGNSRYVRFCGFAYDLQQQLMQRGAKPLFATVRVDNLSQDDLNVWRAQLSKHFCK